MTLAPGTVTFPRRAIASQPRPSGSLPPVAAFPVGVFPGAIRFPIPRRIITAQVLTPTTSVRQGAIIRVGMTYTLIHLPAGVLRLMVMVFAIWQEMRGSGATTGIVVIVQLRRLIRQVRQLARIVFCAGAVGTSMPATAALRAATSTGRPTATTATSGFVLSSTFNTLHFFPFTLSGVQGRSPCSL